MIADLSAIRNIIFDFGGVLFEVDYSAPVRAFEKLGFGSFSEIYSQSVQNEMFDELEIGRMDEKSLLDYLQSFSPEVSADKILDAWNCILIGLWNDQADYVRVLKDKGYKTFLLSNTNAIHRAAFDKMIDDSYGISRFRSLFNNIHYSHELGMRKPHPETFHYVCELNGLRPEETLFIDDSPQHAEGARRAGLHAYHLKKGEKISVVLKDL